MENLTEKEKILWKNAKKRVAFRRHFTTYVLCNLFFWGVWFFTDHKQHDHDGFPWPIFPMLGWGFGLSFHFLGAYVFPHKYESVEKEYEKLKGKQQ